MTINGTATATANPQAVIEPSSPQVVHAHAHAHDKQTQELAPPQKNQNHEGAMPNHDHATSKPAPSVTGAGPFPPETYLQSINHTTIPAASAFGDSSVLNDSQGLDSVAVNGSINSSLEPPSADNTIIPLTPASLYFSAPTSPRNDSAPLSPSQPIDQPSNGTTDANMRFGLTAESRRVSRVRRNMARTNALSEYEAELTSGDARREKDAIRRFLEEKIKNDWQWPPQEGSPEHSPEEALAKEDAAREAAELLELDIVDNFAAAKQREHSEFEHDILEEKWAPRADWSDNTSVKAAEPAKDRPDSGISKEKSVGEEEFAEWVKWSLNYIKAPRSQFNVDQILESFVKMDSIPHIASKVDHISERNIGRAYAKAFLKRKQLARDGDIEFFQNRRRFHDELDEMKTNEGLRCFVDRRNAWTGARPKRSEDEDAEPSGNGKDPEDDLEIYHQVDDWDAEMEVPVAPAILPLDKCPIRRNITPRAYDAIFDKVIASNLTPSCPINLQDMTNALVKGWKRDGTWPAMNSSVPSAPGTITRNPTYTGLFRSDSNRTAAPSAPEGSAAAANRNAAQRGSVASMASNASGSGGKKGLKGLINKLKGKKKE